MTSQALATDRGITRYGFSGMALDSIVHIQAGIQSNSYHRRYSNSLHNSPCAKHFSSNHVASEYEVPIISDILSEQSRDLDEIEQEIDRVKSLLNQLLHDRDEIRDSLERHRGFISATRRVPYEIWGQVFIHCLPAEEFTPVNAFEAPLVFTAVCRWWRSIAISTPKLWNSISIAADTRPSLQVLVQCWLKRSSILPLHIRITQPVEVPYGQEMALGLNLEKVVFVLITFSNRWYNVTMSLSAWARARLLGSSIPNLHRLYLTVPFASTNEFSQISNTAVNLRSLTIKCRFIHITAFNFPWSQLSEFVTASPIHFSDCLEIFRSCPNLSRLSLRDIRGSHDGQDHPQATMTKLSFLELFSGFYVGTVLDCLTLPSLREAHMRSDFPAWPKPEIVALCRRSSCPLEKLSLPGEAIHENDLMDLVEEVSTLREVQAVCDGNNYVTTKIADFLALRCPSKDQIQSKSS